MRGLLFVDGSSRELDGDYLFNRSISFLVEEEDEDGGYVLTKSLGISKIHRMCYPLNGEFLWWIERGACRYTSSLGVR